jgi:ubiquitin carboxyl-terminal hydrolase L5
MSGGWNTIESDAVRPPQPNLPFASLTNPHQGVFTYLIEKLGVKDVQFEELTTLEASELEQLGTVYGVIFLFKYPTGEARGDTPQDGTYDHDAANKLFFAAQTIQNACGTQAIVSLLLNREKEVDIGKELKEFKEFAGEFPPEVWLITYVKMGGT